MLFRFTYRLEMICKKCVLIFESWSARFFSLHIWRCFVLNKPTKRKKNYDQDCEKTSKNLLPHLSLIFNCISCCLVKLPKGVFHLFYHVLCLRHSLLYQCSLILLEISSQFSPFPIFQTQSELYWMEIANVF